MPTLILTVFRAGLNKQKPSIAGLEVKAFVVIRATHLMHAQRPVLAITQLLV